MADSMLTVLLAISGDASGAISALSDTEGKMDKLSGKVGDNRAGLAMMGGALTAAGAMTGNFLTDAIQDSADFNQQLMTLQGIAGTDAQKTEELRQKALQLGADTVFSAGDSLEVMKELNKAGLDVDTVMNGAARSTLDLATATETDVATSVTVLSDSLNTFKNEYQGVADKSSQVANIISSAANASSIDVKDIGYSIAASGATAAGAGFKFNDLATAIAVMGNNGIKGSDAGTSLKTMMINLTPHTSAAAGMMEQLGLRGFDTAKAMQMLENNGMKLQEANGKWIANGKSYNTQQEAIDETLWKLTEHTGTYAEAGEKAQKAFGKWKEETGLVSDAFHDANGNVRDFASIADALREHMKDLTAEQRQNALYTMFGTDALRAANVLYNEGGEGVRKMAADMAGANDITVQANNRLDNLAGSTEQLSGSLDTMRIALGDKFQQPIRWLVDRATELVNGFMAMPEPVKDFVAGLLGLIAVVGLVGGPIAAFAAFLPVIAGGLGSVAAAAAPIILPILAIGAAIFALKMAWDNNFLGIQDIITAFWNNTLAPFLQQAGQWLQQKIPEALQFLQNLWQQGWQAIQAFVMPILTAIFGELAKFWLEIQPRLTEVWNFISNTLIPVAWNIISTILLTGLNVLKNGWDMIWGGIVNVLKGVWDIIQGVVTVAWQLVSGLIKVGLDLLTGHWGDAWRHIQEMVAGIWQGIQQIIGGALNLIKGVLEAALGLLKGIWETFWNWAGGFLTDTWNNLVKWVKDGIDNAKANIEAGLNGIKLLWDSIWGLVSSKAQEIWNNIVTSVTTKLSEIKTFLEQLPGQLVNGAINIGKSMIDGILRGLQNAGGAVSDFIKNLAMGALDTIKRALGIQSPSAVMRDEVGAPIAQGVAHGMGEHWGAVNQEFTTQAEGTVAVAQQFGQRMIAATVSEMEGIKATTRDGLTGITQEWQAAFASGDENGGKGQGAAMGGIWLALFDKGSGFFQKLDDRIKYELDWQRYEIWMASFNVLLQSVVGFLGRMQAEAGAKAHQVGLSVAQQLAAGIRAGIPEISAAMADATAAAGGSGGAGGSTGGSGGSTGQAGSSSGGNTYYNVRTQYVDNSSMAGAQAQQQTQSYMRY